jgi:hypothetical protein
MRTRKMAALALVLSVAAVATLCAACQQPCHARLLGCQEMASLAGGACETGCETDYGHCGEWTGSCQSALDTGSCVRCSSDAEQESCHDWGFCVSWMGSCSVCVNDDPHDCGTETAGNCGGGYCHTGDDLTPCGSVTQCHTDGGW